MIATTTAVIQDHKFLLTIFVCFVDVCVFIFGSIITRAHCVVYVLFNFSPMRRRQRIECIFCFLFSARHEESQQQMETNKQREIIKNESK